MTLQNLVNGSKKVGSYIWVHREAVLLIVIAILLFFLLYHKPIPSNTIERDPLTLDTLKQLRDANNKAYVIIAQQIVESKDQGHIMDSMAKALKIKPKFIQGATVIVQKIDTQFRDTGRLVILGGDTAHLVQKHDPWIDISAYAYTDPKKWKLDHIDFKFRDSIYFIETYKTHLFSPTEYNLIVKSANPYIQTTQGASYKVREKKPWLVIGPGGGYQLLPTTTWSVGLYAIYPILSLKK